MEAYLELLREVRSSGVSRRDRTGVGTSALFARSISCDLQRGFPLLTTKRVHFKSVKHELLWFLRGGSNVRELQQQGVSIWDEWADENGDLGPVYGRQWRCWQGPDGGSFDQIAALSRGLVEDPHSRRHIVSAWNVADLPAMRLAPCHILFQAWVADATLSLQVYQRSADLFLGVPFNIASYALLTHLLARQAGLQPGRLTLVLGDVHLYSNHLQQADLQLGRSPRPLPQIEIGEVPPDLRDCRAEQIRIVNYDPHPSIKAEIAV